MDGLNALERSADIIALRRSVPRVHYTLSHQGQLRRGEIGDEPFRVRWRYTGPILVQDAHTVDNGVLLDECGTFSWSQRATEHVPMWTIKNVPWMWEVTVGRESGGLTWMSKPLGVVG